MPRSNSSRGVADGGNVVSEARGPGAGGTAPAGARGLVLPRSSGSPGTRPPGAPTAVLQFLVLAGDLPELVLQPLDAHLEVGILGQGRTNKALRSKGEHRGGCHGTESVVKSG